MNPKVNRCFSHCAGKIDSRGARTPESQNHLEPEVPRLYWGDAGECEVVSRADPSPALENHAKLSLTMMG